MELSAVMLRLNSFLTCSHLGMYSESRLTAANLIVYVQDEKVATKTLGDTLANHLYFS